MKYLKIFFISMLPLVELRLAMPYARVMGLPFWPSLIVAVLGNMLPVPFIYYLAHKILVAGVEWPIFGSFAKFCLKRGEIAGRKIEAKAGLGLYIALFLFVAIPLPGTGAWTGTLGASMLQLDFKKTVMAVCCGIIAAGLLLWFVTSGLIRLA
ncbi:MAG: small multi-drug export protein [Eubacteriales bacterium]|nr:small multi-drug export protein [Eubacteriales bacterium]